MISTLEQTPTSVIIELTHSVVESALLTHVSQSTVLSIFMAIKPWAKEVMEKVEESMLLTQLSKLVAQFISTVIKLITLVVELAWRTQHCIMTYLMETWYLK